MTQSGKNREREIFEQALDLPSESRKAFVKNACTGNRDLRQKVEELLEVHLDAQEFMKTQDRNDQQVDYDTEATDSAEIREAPGCKIGPYKLLEQIGEGGFGVVYMAEQNKPIYRRVALKIVKMGMDTKQVIGRFEAERQALALMDHPNIARVLDAGTTHSGRPYFVMELVRGEPIDTYCDRNKLNTKERLELFVATCRAVHHAHQKGIIHRDIKPSNVLVAHHDGNPIPKVIDFGIAKAIQQKLTELTVFTHFQQFVGTPEYVSPEQADISALDIDTRADVYSLGVLLYVILSGKPPFERKEILKAGFEEMRRLIREVEPSKPSTKFQTLPDHDRTSIASARQTNERQMSLTLSGDLDCIVMKALEKDRSRRYESSAAFAEDVERHLNNEPINAVAPSNLYKIKKFIRRNTKAVLGSIILLLLFLGTSIIFVTLSNENAQREAELRHTAEENAKWAELRGYTSDIFAAQSLIDAGNLGAAKSLLQEYIPSKEPGTISDLRGFEWRYLWNQLKGEQIRTLEGHLKGLSGLNFSSNGHFLASVSADKTIRIWDWRNGKELQRIEESHPCGFGHFSYDDNYLIVKVKDSLHVYQQMEGRFVFDFDFYLPGNRNMSLSPNQNILAYITKEHFVDFLDLDTGKRIENNQTSPRIKMIENVVFSPNGKLLAGNTGNETITVYEYPTLRELGRLPFDPSRHPARPAYLKFNGSSDRLIEYGPTGIFLIHDWVTGKTEQPIAYQNTVGAFAMHSDGDWMVATAIDHRVRIFDLNQQKLIRTFQGHFEKVYLSSISPDGKFIATGGKDGRILIWEKDLNPGTEKQDCEVFPFPLQPPFSASGRYVAFSNMNHVPIDIHHHQPFFHGVYVYDLVEKKLRQFKEFHSPLCFENEDPVLIGLRIDTDAQKGRLSREITFSHIVRLHMEGRVLSEIPLEHDQLCSIMPRMDMVHGWIALGSAEGFIDILNVNTGKKISSWKADEEPIHEAIFSPDGKWLATTAQRGARMVSQSSFQNFSKVKLWDLSKFPEEIPSNKVIDPDAGQVYGLIFTPDSSQVILPAHDSISIWEVETGTRIATLKGPRDFVISASVSPDGKTLITGNRDGIIFWSMGTYRELMSLTKLGQVSACSFAPDGSSISFLSGSKSPWLPQEFGIIRASRH